MLYSCSQTGSLSAGGSGFIITLNERHTLSRDQSSCQYYQQI